MDDMDVETMVSERLDRMVLNRIDEAFEKTQQFGKKPANEQEVPAVTGIAAGLKKFGLKV